MTEANDSEQERKARAAEAIAGIMAELRNPYGDLEIQEGIMLIDDVLAEAGFKIGGIAPQNYDPTESVANIVPFRRKA